MSTLSIGNPAPDFSLDTDHIGQFTLSDHKGKAVIVFFYPKDDTSGCTVETIEFTQLLPKFDALGAVVIGISPDSIADHEKFRQKFDLQIPLGADPKHLAIEPYGAWGDKQSNGVTKPGLLRKTFLVAPNGTLAQSWDVGDTKGHATQVLAATEKLLA